MRRSLAFAAAGLIALLAADVAAANGPSPDPGAQPPEGAASQDPASSGTTDLEGQGTFGAAAERDEEAGDTLELDVSFGALIATGNSRSTAITGGTNFLLRRGRHQAYATFLGNYGRAAATLDTDPVDTVGNIQARARYDIFVADRWSLFAMVTARHDPFQLLDLRMNVDPGAAYHIINKQTEKLRVEAGYDFQLDEPSDAAVERNQDGSVIYDFQGNTTPQPRRLVHAARLASGYSNNVNEAIGFATELEYLQSFLQAQRWRLNWTTSFTALLVRKLSLSATFTLRMDNDPLQGAKHLDTITAVNLLYRFF